MSKNKILMLIVILILVSFTVIAYKSSTENPVHQYVTKESEEICNIVPYEIKEHLTNNFNDPIDTIYGNYSIKIKSIIFNYCDNKNICDLYYEAYDVVEVEVIR